MRVEPAPEARSAYVCALCTLVVGLALSVLLGGLAWWVNEVVDPHSRIETLGLLVAITLVGGALYIGGIRLLGGMPERPPQPAGAPDAPDVVDLEPADVGAEE